MLRRVTAVLISASICAVAQQAAPAPVAAATEVSPDAVVAVLNGKKFTAGDVQRLVAVLPPQVQTAFKADPKQFLRDHAWYLTLVDYAEKQKLDTQSPVKERLEFVRLMVLYQAAYDHALRQVDVTPAEQQKYYEANREVFREAQVRMIYFPFTDALTEGEAKAKAEAAAKRAREGEDFAKLIKENSGDESAGAPFSVKMDSAQPPVEMRRAILALKTGETTPALRHDNGYYVFRVESTSVLPFEKVRDDIYKTIRDAKFRDWERQAKSQSTVQFENEAFFQNISKEK